MRASVIAVGLASLWATAACTSACLAWSRLMVWSAAWVLGIRYRVVGAENIPREPCVILGKHESAWETLAFQVIFPPQVWVVKRELLWIPFFGWGLAMLSPIARLSPS